MKLFILYVLVPAACFEVKWNDFRGGGIALPITENNAIANAWVLIQQDDTHEVNWYSVDNDQRFSVGYDQRTGDCHGVRIIEQAKDIDPNFLAVYEDPKGIFEIVKIAGEKCYKSTVIFSPKGYVTQNGQDEKAEDEVAYFAFIRMKGLDKMIHRDICPQYVKRYIEQGCHIGYGLVMSAFGKKTECKDLRPFYAIYDPIGNGELIGFGWITFLKKKATENSIIKQMSTKEAKNMFPQRPSCLTSTNLAQTQVWLSYAGSWKITCPKSSWVVMNCAKVPQEVDEPQGYYAIMWHRFKRRLGL